jgi:acyl carrier protein
VAAGRDRWRRSTIGSGREEGAPVEDIVATATRVIAKVARIDSAKITPELELVADLGFDSAKALELLVELESTLGIEISDEDAARLNTVGDILGYLAR